MSDSIIRGHDDCECVGCCCFHRPACDNPYHRTAPVLGFKPCSFNRGYARPSGVWCYWWVDENTSYCEEHQIVIQDGGHEL